MKRNTPVLGTILVIVGIIFLLQNFGFVPDAFSKLWALILVAIGISWILKGWEK